MGRLRFFIPATLRTKGNSMEIRTRRTPKGLKRWISPTDAQKAAEQAVRLMSLPYAPPAPLQGPISLSVTICVPIPKGYKPEKRARCLSGEMRPDTKDKGDRGNHLKLLEDALEGVFYVNDAQICEGNVAKVFCDQSGYLVEIELIL